MLTLLTGRAHRLWPRVARDVGAALAEKRRVAVLVPEQLTLDTERALIRDLRLPGFFDIDVLSPTRLAQCVFARAGADARVRLDAVGRQIAVRRALQLCADKLVFYGDAADRPGLSQSLGELIVNLKRGGVMPQAAAEQAEALGDTVLAHKLRDAARVYERYERLLQGRLADSDDIQNCMLQRLDACGLFVGTRVFVYGFDVFTYPLCRLLCVIAAQAESVCASLLSAPEKTPDGELYAAARQSAERLVSMAEQRTQFQTEDAPFDAPPDIAWLERYTFSYPAKPFPGEVSAVRLYAAPTPYAEAHAVAAALVGRHMAGVPWADMRVVSAALDRHADMLRSVFEDALIPCYIDVKTPACRQGVCRFLLGAARAATGGFRLEDVLEYAKSGFAPAPQDDVFHFERYARAYGLRGAKLLEPFTRGADDPSFAIAERAREALMPPLERLRGELRAAVSAEDSLRALTNFLKTCGTRECVETQESELRARGMLAEAMRARQAYGAIVRCLEQAYTVAGDARIPASRVAQWLEEGLGGVELAALPPTSECVTVSALGRAVPGRARVMFLMHLTDDAFTQPREGLLSDEEQALAERAFKTTLGVNGTGREALRMADLKRVMASPTEQLCLSYALSTQTGGALRPAPIVTQVRRLLPTLEERGGALACAGAPLPCAPAIALGELGTRLRAGAPEARWRSARDWLMASDDYARDIRALDSALRGGFYTKPLEPQVARRLLGGRGLSVSRLETYADCPFRYFVRYGLRPARKREWKVQTDLLGVFYHGAIERFTRAAAQDEQWPRVPREKTDALMEEALAPLREGAFSDMIADSARTRVAFDQYARVLKRAAWMLARHACASRFETRGSEVTFGFEDSDLPPVVLSLTDGAHVALRGVIDRVDVCEYQGATYVRVVDYKSGGVTLDPARVLEGAQLQLLIYLLAASGRDIPAGAFYFRVHDPFVPAPEDARKTAEQLLTERFRLSGIALNNVEIVHLMDGEKPMVSLAEQFKTDETPMASARLADETQMRCLLKHARRAAVSLCERMRDGLIDACPLYKGKHSACDACDYRAVCRFDPRLPGARRRELNPIPLRDLLERLSDAEDAQT